MTKLIAITGPPAAGKTTVGDLLEDLGLPVISTGDAVRELAAERHDDPDEDDIWHVAKDLRNEHGPAGPTIACQDYLDGWVAQNKDIIVVNGLRDQAEVDWLEENYGSVLVVRVDTRNESERIERYVEREIGNLHDDEPVSMDQERELRDEVRRREHRESPYPQHHVTIMNDNTVRMDELMYRLQGICGVLDSDGDYHTFEVGDEYGRF